MDFTTIVKKFKSEVIVIDVHRFFISDEGRNIWDYMTKFLDYKEQENFWLAVMPRVQWSEKELLLPFGAFTDPAPNMTQQLLAYFSKKEPKLIAKLFLGVMDCWDKGTCPHRNTISRNIFSNEKPKSVIFHAWEHLQNLTRIKIFPKKQKSK